MIDNWRKTQIINNELPRRKRTGYRGFIFIRPKGRGIKPKEMKILYWHQLFW